MNTLCYSSDFSSDVYDVAFKLDRYLANNSLALEFYYADGDCYLPFFLATVCLPDFTPPSLNGDFVYLDVNNVPGVLEFMLLHDLCSAPISYAPSGFCLYPLVRLNLETIKLYLLEDLS